MVDQQQIHAGGCQFPNKFGANMESADWPWPFFGPQRVSWQLLASLSRSTSQRWVDGGGGRDRREDEPTRGSPEPAGAPPHSGQQPPARPLRAHGDCPGRKATVTQVALPLATRVAREERALAPGGRGCTGRAPLTRPLGTAAGGGGAPSLNLVVEGSWLSAHDRSQRVSEISCPGGASFGDGHSASPTAPSSPLGFNSALISCPGKSFAIPSPLPARLSRLRPPSPGLP